MPDHNTPFSPEFIEQQRARLTALRTQILGGEARTVSNGRTKQEEHGKEAHEFEDEAQDMAQNEIEQARHDVDKRRLFEIDRALQKIAEGNYGFSDVSGKPIPQARLEVIPEAILTVEEEQHKESGLQRR